MIVYACADLIFATKIRATAEALGVITRPTRDAAALQKRLDRIEDDRPNEPVTAVMLDLEMGEPALALLDQVKTHDPGIPVIAFGSHVAVDVLQAARARGADEVLPRSAFTARLSALLETYAGREA